MTELNMTPVFKDSTTMSKNIIPELDGKLKTFSNMLAATVMNRRLSTEVAIQIAVQKCNATINPGTQLCPADIYTGRSWKDGKEIKINTEELVRKMKERRKAAVESREKANMLSKRKKELEKVPYKQEDLNSPLRKVSEEVLKIKVGDLVKLKTEWNKNNPEATMAPWKVLEISWKKKGDSYGRVYVKKIQAVEAFTGATEKWVDIQLVHSVLQKQKIVSNVRQQEDIETPGNLITFLTQIIECVGDMKALDVRTSLDSDYTFDSDMEATMYMRENDAQSNITLRETPPVKQLPIPAPTAIIYDAVVATEQEMYEELESIIADENRRNPTTTTPPSKLYNPPKEESIVKEESFWEEFKAAEGKPESYMGTPTNKTKNESKHNETKAEYGTIYSDEEDIEEQSVFDTQINFNDSEGSDLDFNEGETSSIPTPRKTTPKRSVLPIPKKNTAGKSSRQSTLIMDMQKRKMQEKFDESADRLRKTAEIWSGQSEGLEDLELSIIEGAPDVMDTGCVFNAGERRARPKNRTELPVRIKSPKGSKIPVKTPPTRKKKAKSEVEKLGKPEIIGDLEQRTTRTKQKNKEKEKTPTKKAKTTEIRTAELDQPRLLGKARKPKTTSPAAFHNRRRKEEREREIDEELGKENDQSKNTTAKTWSESFYGVPGYFSGAFKNVKKGEKVTRKNTTKRDKEEEENVLRRIFNKTKAQIRSFWATK